MSLLAAAPVAVLVLAWDETAPAVRAVVAAAETSAAALASLVVLVPAGPAATPPAALLPPAALPELLPTAPATTAAGATDAPATAETQRPEQPLIEAVAATPVAAAASPEPAALPTAPTPTATPVVAPAAPATAGALQPEAGPLAPPPPPAWAAVRVLRLSSFGLPALAAQAGTALPGPTWRGSEAAPVAPYIGSSGAAAAAAALPIAAATPAPEYQARQVVSTDYLSPLPAPSPNPAQPASAAQAAAHPPAALAFTDLDPAALSLEQPELPPLAAEELPAEAAATSPENEASSATRFTPAQASWPEALATLQHPAAEATTAAETPAETVGTDPRPPTASPTPEPFAAPNLNFQIIQYARFAVPLALAEAPFGAIYAPAWPTWLAAQELRQRTGRPLVLHVSTLAAAAGDLLETATGWQAELQRQALHRADVILAETPALAQRLRQELSPPPLAVPVVPAADAAAVAQALHAAQPSGGQ